MKFFKEGQSEETETEQTEKKHTKPTIEDYKDLLTTLKTQEKDKTKEEFKTYINKIKKETNKIIEHLKKSTKLQENKKQEKE